MAKKGSQLTVRTSTEIQGGEFVILGYAGKSYQMTLDELKKFIGIIEADGGSVDLTQVSTDILPLADASKDIGSLEKRWKKVYSTALTVKAQSVDEEEVNIHDGGIEGKIGRDIQWSIDGSGKANFYELTVDGADVATMQYVNNELSKILGGASGAYDTLKEIEDILKNDTTGLAALLEEIGTKADKSTVIAINGRVTDLEDSDFVDIEEFRDTLNPLVASLQGGIDSLWSRDSFDELYAGHLMADSVAAERMYADEGDFDSLSVDGKAVALASDLDGYISKSAAESTSSEIRPQAFTPPSDRWYKVYYNSAVGKMYVNVPWVDAGATDVYTRGEVDAIKSSLESNILLIGNRVSAIESAGYLTSSDVYPLLVKDSNNSLLLEYIPTQRQFTLKLQASHVGLGNVRNVSSYSQDEVEDMLKGYLPVAGGQITGDLNVSGDLTMNGAFYVGNSESDFASIDEDGNGVFKSLKVGGSRVALASDLSGYLPLSGGTIKSTEEQALTLCRNESAGGIGIKFEGEKQNGWVGYMPSSYGVYLYTNTHYLYLTKDGVAKLDANTLIHSGNYSSYALPLSGGTISGDLRLKQYLRINAWEGYGAGSCDAWYNGNDGSLCMTASDIRLGSDYSKTVIHSGNIGTYVGDFLTSLQGGIDSLWSRDSFDELYAGHLMADSVAAERMYADEGNFGSLSVDGNAVALASDLDGYISKSAAESTSSEIRPQAFTPPSDRWYKVYYNSAVGKMYVNVPWVDTGSTDVYTKGEVDAIKSSLESNILLIGNKVSAIESAGYITSSDVYPLLVKDSNDSLLLEYSPTQRLFTLKLQASHVGLGNVENTKLSTWAGSANITTLGTITDGTWSGEKIGQSYLDLDGYLTSSDAESTYLKKEGGQITGNLLVSGAFILEDSFYIGTDASNYASIDSDGNGVFKSLKVGGSRVALASDLSGYLPLSGGTISGDLRLKQYLRINAWEGYGTGSCDAWYNGNDGRLYMNASGIRLGTETVIHTGNIGTYVGDFLTSLQGGIDSLWSRDSFDELYAGHLMADSVAAERMYADEIETSTAIMGNNKTLSLFPSRQTSEVIIPIKISKIGSQHTLYCDEAAVYDLGTSTSRFAKVYCTEVQQSSDASLKDIVGDIPLTVGQIADAPAVSFKWKSGMDEASHVGTIAQYWKDILPEVVSGEEGSMSIEYATLGVVSSIVLARAMARYEKRMAILENEINELKNR